MIQLAVRSVLRICLVLWFAGAATGCRTRYDIKLSGGQVITAHSRPKLNAHGQYEFKDERGQITTIGAGRVREIERR